MVTGQRPFAGPTTSDVMAAILTRAPDWSAVPAEMKVLLQACLEKNPKQRLRDMGDAWRLLAGAESKGTPATGNRTRALAAAALVVIAALAAWGWWRSREKPATTPVVLDVDLGSKPPDGVRPGADAILSPAGTQLVYVSGGRLFTRRLDESMPRELPQTEGAYAPFFSPDGEWVGFFAGSKLKNIRLRGGPAEELQSVARARGGTWSEDGNIIFAQENIGGLSRIPASGGGMVPVTELTSGERTHRWPQLLPGGKAVLFTANESPLAGFDAARIVAENLKDHRRKVLLRGGSYGRYVPSGHLLYVKGGNLYAVRFDVDRLEVHGTPTEIFDRVAYNSLNGAAQFDVSRSGTLVYRSGGGGLVKVDWLNADGGTHPLIDIPGQYLYPTISPDGQKLAMVVVQGANQELWTFDWQRDIRSRLTQKLFTTNPCWTPSGRYVLFQAFEGMDWVPADGRVAPQALTKSEELQYPWSFAPGANRLAYGAVTRDFRRSDLWTVPFSEDSAGPHAGNPELFLHTAGVDRHPSFSPDGQWLAYDSDESGTSQVYVLSFPGKTHKVQISSSGGAFPLWSRVRKELFFRGADNRVMVAGYQINGRSFTPGKARVWSDTRLAEQVNENRNFDLAPDGMRVAALVPGDSDEPTPRNRVVFVLNFLDELRRISPP